MTESVIHFTHDVNVAPQSDADAIQEAVLNAIEAFGVERLALSLCESREVAANQLAA
jgi:2C-methyl-D-erythritol 2,4-cyclodiphosphate synthase